MKRNSGWLLIILAATVTACGDGPTTGPQDAATEAGTNDVGGDGGRNDGGRSDGGRDATRDTGSTMVRAGMACTADSDCAEGQECRNIGANGFCTQSCEPGTVAEERMQCGGVGSTCLRGSPLSEEGQGICTRTCSTTAGGTAGCRQGTICTGYWYNNMGGMPDSAGCFPFCSNDSQCAGVTAGDGGMAVCNIRTGRCGPAPFDPTLRRDGDACNPMEIAATMRAQCRGICFGTSNTVRTQGICGSFINVRATPVCPDDAMQPTLTRPSDNLGICLFRFCETNSNCAAGHICRYQEAMGMPATEGPTVCDFPTTAQPTGITTAGDGGVGDGGTDASTGGDAGATTDVSRLPDIPPPSDATVIFPDAIDAG